MSAPVLKLTDRVEDVRYETVKDTLERTLKNMESGGFYEDKGFVATRCVVVLVDERDQRYTLKVLQSAGKLSETVALLELAKMNEARQMFKDL